MIICVISKFTGERFHPSPATEPVDYTIVRQGNPEQKNTEKK